ncbi:MAG TPA: serine hydrolase [Thermoanaerobaculia bacterium]|nr:serine hydrolase [Thermoanaerobaculia bacterium]
MLLTRRRFALMLAGGAAALHSGCATSRRSDPRLESWRNKARGLGVRGVVVLRGEDTLLSDGDIATPMRIASIRKSLVSALFGIAVAEGRVKLDATLADLGIDDYTPLTPTERGATVRQLLTARSGVYLPTAAETQSMRAARPERGSHAPGTFWYYNNWDFNVLGEIYQRTTGESLFTALEHRLARPLGWRDFDPLRHAVWSYDRESPRFPAYNLQMSARDMALFGRLFLQRGRWNGRQLIPEQWVGESTQAHSITGRAGFNSGYGYMWWVVPDDPSVDRRGLPVGTFTAAGNGGRYISVIPSLNLVVALQPDEKRGQPPVRLYAEPHGYTDLLAELIAYLRMTG